LYTIPTIPISAVITIRMDIEHWIYNSRQTNMEATAAAAAAKEAEELAAAATVFSAGSDVNVNVGGAGDGDGFYGVDGVSVSVPGAWLGSINTTGLGLRSRRSSTTSLASVTSSGKGSLTDLRRRVTKL
jgi:hypothetical protein